MTKRFTSRSHTASDIFGLENGTELRLSSLPAFLRVLLTTDGTVTKSLESFFWEPITVHKIRQQREVLEFPLNSIEKQAGEEVILREVELVGDDIKSCYARAYSYVQPEALPDEICRDLEQDKVGIGELLRECGLETYRELMSIGKEHDGDTTLITRTYRIVMGQHPFIQITEKFPLDVYR